MSAFNPYSHWLGIVGKEKPDTYYELLGLKHGESNVAKIANRADELLAKVQKMRDNDHFSEWNQLLTEIQVAKNCLCNPKQKAEYDQKRPHPSAYNGATPGMQQGVQPGIYPQQGGYPQQGAYPQPGIYPQQGVQVGTPLQGIPVQSQPVAQPVSVQVAQPVVTPQPIAQPVASADPLFSINTSPTKKVRSKKSPKRVVRKKKSASSSVTRNIIAIVGVCLVGFLGYQLYQESLKQAPNNDEALTNQDAQPSELPDDLKTLEPDAPDEIAKKADADSQTPNFEGIRQALKKLDFNRARNLLSNTKKMSLSPEDKERQERLQKIVHYSSSFYKQMNNMLLTSKPPMELCDKKYGLVDVTEVEEIDGSEVTMRTSATIRIDGKNVLFTMSQPKKQGNSLYDILYRHQFANDTGMGKMNSALGYAILELATKDGDNKTAIKLLCDVAKKGTEKHRQAIRQICDEFNVDASDIMTTDEEQDFGFTTNLETDEEQKPNAPKAQETEALKEPPNEKAQETEASKETQNKKEAETKASKGAKKKNSKRKKRKGDDKNSDDNAKFDAETHQKEWWQLTTAARQDLSWRRIPAVRENLEKLERIIQTDNERDELYRLNVLTDYMEHFIAWIEKQMGTFEPASTVNVDGVDIGIVESEIGQLVIREQGVNKRYTVENLNPKLVNWLIGDSLTDQHDYVLYGTYLAMDTAGDRAKAGLCWTTAVEKGFNKRLGKFLLQELTVELPNMGPRMLSQELNDRIGRKKPSRYTQEQAIPTVTERENALKSILEEFKEDYANEDAPSQMKMVAKFMSQAQATKRNPAEAYVMTEEASRIALKNGHYKKAYDALLIQETRFQRDTYLERIEIITGADPTIRGSSSTAELLECASQLGLEAVQRNNKRDVKHILGILQKNAKGSQRKRAVTLEQQLKMMR